MLQIHNCLKVTVKISAIFALVLLLGQCRPRKAESTLSSPLLVQQWPEGVKYICGGTEWTPIYLSHDVVTYATFREGKCDSDLKITIPESYQFFSLPNGFSIQTEVALRCAGLPICSRQVHPMPSCTQEVAKPCCTTEVPMPPPSLIDEGSKTLKDEDSKRTISVYGNCMDIKIVQKEQNLFDYVVDRVEFVPNSSEDSGTHEFGSNISFAPRNPSSHHPIIIEIIFSNFETPIKGIQFGYDIPGFLAVPK